MTVTDYNGTPLAEGDHVEAWLSGERYTATVLTIRAPVPGDGNFRRIVLVPDGGAVPIDSYSDSVVVLSGKQDNS